MTTDNGIYLQSVLLESIELYRRGKLAEAERLCARILSQQPEHFHALHLLGVLALQTRRTGRGVELLTKALAIDPDFAPAHCNLGNGLRDLKRPEEALASYDLAIGLRPDFAEAHCNRGNALAELRRPEEALASYDRAIALKPDFAEAHSNRGRALLDLNRPEDALESCNRAIALKPAMAKAWGSRGVALNRLKRCDQAAESYAKLLEIDPQHPFMKGMYLYQKMQSCDWKGIDRLIDEIESEIAAHKMPADPFGWQGVAKSPRSLQLCAERFNEYRFPGSAEPFTHPRAGGKSRIRIGYLSGEFREHATSLLLAGVLEHHDDRQFEIFAFDNGWDDGSQTRKRIERSVYRLVNINRFSDFQAATVINENRIDILVNLNGYFGGERTLVLARRPAPIQVNYLGFPGTLGADYIDYIMADKYVIPAGHEAYYTEKIVYLPNCYQANDRRKEIGPRVLRRAEAGLPEDGFVFCCFNNNYKILPEVFSVWMNILRQVEGSVLWLLEDNRTASDNLRREAAARGIGPERLIFAGRMPLSDHLARHRCADLFLDTLPYNAHTTASDALWAGLPLLTCLGQTFAGRVAASLLFAIHLPELIATSLEMYERLAIDLARDPKRLARIKQKLANNRLTTPLFDTRSFARQIEMAYAAMYARHQANLAPDHVVISS